MSTSDISPKKSVFITGASSGIGFYLALEFAQRGYQVFAGARRVDAMEPLKRQGVTTIEMDVTSTESILAAKQIIMDATGGRLDILYNNAGISHPRAIFDLDKERIDYVFRVNVFGPLELIKEFQEPLLKSEGTVAFTGSVVQYVPPPFAISYAASKASMSYVAKVLALETGKLGIKVVDVVTGAVESGIWDDTERSTPKNSIYYVEGNEEMGSLTSVKTPTAVYTKQAVDGIEKAIRKGTPYTQIFAGSSSTFAWIMGNFIPFWLYAKVIFRALKLDAVMKKVNEKLRSKQD